MNTQRAGLRVASFLFGLVCLGHLWRLFAHVAVRIGSHDLAMWLSGIAAFLTAVMSIWLWSLSKR